MTLSLTAVIERKRETFFGYILEWPIIHAQGKSLTAVKRGLKETSRQALDSDCRIAVAKRGKRK